MAKYSYTIHMMCGGEFYLYEKKPPKKFMERIMKNKGDEYIICEDDENREIIIMKQQIEYVTAEKIKK